MLESDGERGTQAGVLRRVHRGQRDAQGGRRASLGERSRVRKRARRWFSGIVPGGQSLDRGARVAKRVGVGGGGVDEHGDERRLNAGFDERALARLVFCAGGGDDGAAIGDGFRMRRGERGPERGDEVHGMAERDERVPALVAREDQRQRLHRVHDVVGGGARVTVRDALARAPARLHGSRADARGSPTGRRALAGDALAERSRRIRDAAQIALLHRGVVRPGRRRRGVLAAPVRTRVRFVDLRKVHALQLELLHRLLDRLVGLHLEVIDVTLDALVEGFLRDAPRHLHRHVGSSSAAAASERRSARSKKAERRGADFETGFGVDRLSIRRVDRSVGDFGSGRDEPALRPPIGSAAVVDQLGVFRVIRPSRLILLGADLNAEDQPNPAAERICRTQTLALHRTYHHPTHI